MKYRWYIIGGLVACMITICVVAVLTTPQFGPHDNTDYLLRSVADASRSFKREYGTWPASLSSLSTNNPKRLLFLLDMEKGGVLLDRWGHPLVYIPYNQEAGCGVVISWGADGEPGGKNQDRDRIARFK